MKTAASVLALALGLALTSTLAASDPKAAEEAAVDGANLIQAGKPREALPLLDRSLRLDPRSAWAYLVRGNAYSDLREFDRAVDDFDQALALDPKYHTAWFNRGNVCQRVGRYKQAIQHYDKALTLSPPADLERRIRKAKANSEASQRDVFKGVLLAPQEDAVKLAREAGAHADPMAFWKRVGKVTVFSMQRKEVLPNGGERTLFNTLRGIEVAMPMGRGKWRPIPVYIPLQRGDILHTTVPLRCPPGKAVLHENDPLGYRSQHVKIYLEWLYFKSGL
jgi:tetratricopeptide (TPR) repeat protein